MFETVAKLSTNLRGILLMVAATLFLTSMSTMVRSLTDEMHPFEIAFMRNLFGFALLVPVLVRARFVQLKTTKLGFMATRGAFNAVAMVFYFMAIAVMPLAEVSALTFTTPLFVALLAVPLLHEKLGLRRIMSLVIGFSGALIILRPGADFNQLGAFYALTSAAGWAVAVIVIKHLSRTESSVTITVYGTFFLALFTLVPALFVWRWPTPGEFLTLGAIAVAGTIGQLLFAQALKSADVSLVMPFDFTKLIWASLFGYLFFQQIPTVWTFIGGAVIFASASYVTFRERHAGKAPSALTNELSLPKAPSG